MVTGEDWVRFTREVKLIIAGEDEESTKGPVNIFDTVLAVLLATSYWPTVQSLFYPAAKEVKGGWSAPTKAMYQFKYIAKVRHTQLSQTLTITSRHIRLGN